MNFYLLDTDTLSLFLQQDVNVIRHVVARATHSLAITVITVQEVWSGWSAIISRAKTPQQFAGAYDRLTTTLNDLRDWPVVTFSLGAISRYTALKKQNLNVGGNDLRIASIALEIGATIVTRNRRDFGRVSGVVIEDWSV